MGFFKKKKNTDTPASVLSESEIQKKLYGEFDVEIPYAVTGDREHFREPAPSVLPPRVPAAGKETTSDLFNPPQDVPTDPDLSSSQTSSEHKTSDHAPRYVSLHDFEKRPIPSVPVSSGTDPYARFRHNRPSSGNKLSVFLDILKGFFSKAADLFRAFLDPKQVVLRRFVYWTVAVLVIFLLFWGVNALNSQREEALRTRYKIPKETTAPVPVNSQSPVETAAKPLNSVVERPVVITPAPIKPKSIRPGAESGTTASSSAGSYVIQVVTYPAKQDAEQIVLALKKEGLHAYVKEYTRPSGRLYYIVFIGGFRTEAVAQAQLLKFRAKEVARPFQDAFVRSSQS